MAPTGLPLTTPLLLDSAVSTIPEPCEREACVRAALDSRCVSQRMVR